MNNRFITLASIAFVASISFSCKDDIAPVIDLPDNNLIDYQYLDGDSTIGYNSIFSIIAQNTYSITSEQFHNNYAIGYKDQYGVSTWRRAIGYGATSVIESMVMIQDEEIVHEKYSKGDDFESLPVIMSCGSSNLELEDESETGIVTMLDYNGNLLSEVEIKLQGYTISLRKVIEIKFKENEPRSSFVVIGRAKNAYGFTVPLFVQIDVVDEYKLKVVKSEVLTFMPNMYFIDGIINYSAGSEGFLTIENFTFLCNAIDPSGDINKVVLCNLDSSFSVNWSTDIVETTDMKSVAYTDGLIKDENGNFYICGRTQFLKSTTPNNDTYWDAGLLASVSSTGNIRWIKAYNFSEHSDKLRGLTLHNGTLYACGVTDDYARDSKTYYQALIIKVNPLNGSLISNYSFGFKQGRCAFNTIDSKNGKLYTAGVRAYPDSKTRQWLAVFNDL